jgi:hypothetical protein
VRIAGQIAICATAFLLVAASPSPTPRNQQSGQPNSHQTVANPLPATTTIAKPQQSPTPEAQTTCKQSEQWYDRIYEQVWPPLWDTFFPPVWSNWALVVIAAWTAWLAVGTLKNIEHQTKSAIISAVAAKQSGEAAQRALQSERPLLWIIDKPEEMNFTPQSQLATPYLLTNAVCKAKNFGNGAAIITDITAALTFKDFPEPKDFSACPKIPIAVERDVIAASDQIEFWVRLDSGSFADGVWRQMEAGAIMLKLYGALRYEDVFGHKYETGFARIRTWGHSGDGRYFGRGRSALLARENTTITAK